MKRIRVRAHPLYFLNGLPRAAALLAGLAVAACGPGEAVPSAEATMRAEAESADPWTRSSAGGAVVSVSIAPVPLRPGPMTVEIELRSGASEVLPVSLDLVAPAMPMHGVVRYEAEVLDTGRYRAAIDVPMEGLWELYVNLDYGADAAVFELDVTPAEHAGAHAHHGGA